MSALYFLARATVIILFSAGLVWSDTASSHMATGSNKLRAGDIAGAEAELRAAISLGIRDPQAYNLLGFICDQANRSSEALAQYQRALELDPGFVPAHNNLGALYLRQGNLTPALEEFRSSLRILPKDPTAYYNIAIIYQQQGQLADAVGSMKRAHQYAPNDGSIFIVLARMQAQLNDGNAVLESAAEFLELLKTNPPVPDSKQAISEMIDLLKVGTGKSPAEEQRLFLLAEFQFLNKDYGHVLSTLNEIPASDRDADYYNLLGVSETALAHFHEARAALAQAIALAPHRADLLFNMGSVYQSARDNRTAIQLFKRAIAEGDSSPQTEFALALGYFNFGDYEGSIRACLHLVKTYPRFDQARLLLGRSYAEISKNEEAVAALRNALAIDPDCEQCNLHLALVLLTMGKDDEATILLRKVILLNPSNASAHFQLGKALARRKENEQAVQELQKAIELNPKQDLAYYQLGHVFLAMGDRPRAQTYLATARTLKEARRAAAQTEMSNQQ